MDGALVELGMYNVFLTAIKIQERLKVAILSLFFVWYLYSWDLEYYIPFST